MRDALRDAERLVIKVGSSSLTTPDGEFNHDRVQELARVVADLHLHGKRVVLVSSGAIAAALRPLGLHKRPRDLETQQAAAAVGQGLLIQHYREAFESHGVQVAQVLLTVSDVVRPGTYRNALNTLSRLFRLHVVPIVNENDTTATHEIRFGDNDRLAALVSHLVRADALLLLTDVDGLYTAHPDVPGASIIREVPDVRELVVDTSRLGSRVGTGGMKTKVEAASIAAQAGIAVALIHADDLTRALAGDEVGTWFHPVGKRRRRILLWLAHAAQVRGCLHVDRGAVAALTQRHASLLAAGITRVEGQFSEGEPVDIAGPHGEVFARGFSNFSSAEIQPGCGPDSRPIVHRDSMILM